jgi:Mlc titration factor MtfA (ptsG expression regulator)
MSVFSFLRDRRRRRILSSRPIPEELWAWALHEHKIFASLDATERRRLRELTTIFLAEKDFHPVQAAEIDEEFRVSVAAQACLPILELGMDWYADWKTVIVTGDAYEITRTETDEAGVVHEYQDELGGEVLHLGPVVLSMADVDESGWGDGYNVVVHEAAHKIDGRDGSFDGCPPLPSEIEPEEWRTVFVTAYERMRAAEGRGGTPRPKSEGRKRGTRRTKGDRIRIDPYAAFSPDEFFAVCTEYFFEKPVVLRSDFPDVYRLLALFYRQDPYERLSRGKAPQLS